MAAPIWDHFVEECIWQGLIRMVPTVQAWDHFTSAHYPLPTQPLLEPEKEFQASAFAIASGLSSWQREVAKYGLDPDELLVEIAEDRARFEAMGLIYPADRPLPGSPQQTATSTPPTEQSREVAS